MALPSAGNISMSQVNVELKKNETAAITLNDTDVRKLAGKPSGIISMSDLRGKSSGPNPKDCDYYFENINDFNSRINSIITENNNDLSQKTFGFGDSVTDLSNAFENTPITSTPKMIVARNATSFAYCFKNCESLTSIPQDLFKNCPNVTDFNNCFYYCAYLATIPQGLFDKCTNVTSFYGCFQMCASLTTIPQWLFDNCPNVTNFSNCFNFCISLIIIPQALFDKCPNVTDFSSCFEDCFEITSALPDAWNKTKFPNVTRGSKYGYGCTKAANFNEIPSDFIN